MAVRVVADRESLRTAQARRPRPPVALSCDWPAPLSPESRPHVAGQRERHLAHGDRGRPSGGEVMGRSTGAHRFAVLVATALAVPVLAGWRSAAGPATGTSSASTGGSGQGGASGTGSGTQLRFGDRHRVGHRHGFDRLGISNGGADGHPHQDAVRGDVPHTEQEHLLLDAGRGPPLRHRPPRLDRSSQAGELRLGLRPGPHQGLTLHACHQMRRGHHPGEPPILPLPVVGSKVGTASSEDRSSVSGSIPPRGAAALSEQRPVAVQVRGRGPVQVRVRVEGLGQLAEVVSEPAGHRPPGHITNLLRGAWIPEAVEATWPLDTVQTCTMHLIRGVDGGRVLRRHKPVKPRCARSTPPQAWTPRSSNCWRSPTPPGQEVPRRPWRPGGTRGRGPSGWGQSG